MVPVTVITPTISGRAELLAVAKMSVERQTVQVEHMVLLDALGQGPAVMRNEGIENADTEWVAFLDDDDCIYPQHIENCLATAYETGADLVYPWFDLCVMGTEANHANPLRIEGADGSLLDPFGQPFTPALAAQLDHRNFIPVTVLVRRAALLTVGGFPTPGTPEWPHPDCEDWGCWQRLRDAGFIFAHRAERTWAWNHHGRNVSGNPTRAREMGLL